MWIYLSLLVCVVGLLIYALTTNNAKIAEVGRLMFFGGLLAFLMTSAQHIVSAIR